MWIRKYFLFFLSSLFFLCSSFFFHSLFFSILAILSLPRSNFLKPQQQEITTTIRTRRHLGKEGELFFCSFFFFLYFYSFFLFSFSSLFSFPRFFFSFSIISFLHFSKQQQKEITQQLFEQECIWENIPFYRRPIAYFRYTRNEDGHLIGSDVCRNVLFCLFCFFLSCSFFSFSFKISISVSFYRRPRAYFWYTINEEGHLIGSAVCRNVLLCMFCLFSLVLPLVFLLFLFSFFFF